MSQQFCKLSGESFEVGKLEQEILARVSPVFAGRRFNLPLPSLAPDLRLQRRLAFRNETSLYQRKSALSGKPIICMYSPDKPYKVYEQDEWWGDSWDALSYGRDFDFNRPFFEQLRELEIDVPHNALYTTGAENSHYTNFSLFTKNCYLVSGISHSEDCMYCNFIPTCKDCLDCLSLYNCELCYEGIASEDCYNCQFFSNCKQCTDCFMLEDCTSCSNCILCFGLYRKEYHILNRPVTKAEYLEFKKQIASLDQRKIAELYLKLADLKRELNHRASHVFASENCTGDGIYSSKNCLHAFDTKHSEDCAYVLSMPKSQMSMDASFGSPDGCQFCYEVCSTVASNSVGTFMCWYSDNIFYSREIQNSRDLFGCVGLKNKQYCILNKQYSEQEYHQLAARIAEHMMQTKEWGEYFPIEISPFAYNETIANDHFPLDKEEALALGWKWRDEEEREVASLRSVLPESALGLSEEICKEIFYCENTARPYKILPKELQFYQKLGLPLPRLSPKERYRLRFAKKAPRRLYRRVCAETGREIFSTYAPNRKERVVSEEVFLNAQR